MSETTNNPETETRRIITHRKADCGPGPHVPSVDAVCCACKEPCWVSSRLAALYPGAEAICLLCYLTGRGEPGELAPEQPGMVEAVEHGVPADVAQGVTQVLGAIRKYMTAQRGDPH